MAGEVKICPQPIRVGLWVHRKCLLESRALGVEKEGILGGKYLCDTLEMGTGEERNETGALMWRSTGTDEDLQAAYLLPWPEWPSQVFWAQLEEVTSAVIFGQYICLSSWSR